MLLVLPIQWLLSSLLSVSTPASQTVNPLSPPSFSTTVNCAAPSLLTLTAATDSTATLTWTDVADAYELELKPLGTAFSGTPTHAVPADPPFTLTGLTPGQQYRVQVRSVCGDGSTSGWSTPRTIATDLNDQRPCPLDFTLRDTSCNSGGQVFKLRVHSAPGTSLGTDVALRGVRLLVEHPWRSDLRMWLTAPDGTRRQVVGNLNAGDQNLGDPTATNGSCGVFVHLVPDTTAPLLTAAAEIDNFTGTWRSVDDFAPFHNGQDPNGTWLLEFCDSKANHTGKLKLAQLVFDPLGCAVPNALTISAVSLNDATVTWSPAALVGDSVQIAYGPAGFLPGIGAGQLLQLPTATATATLGTGLTPLAWHDAYLRQRCPDGSWSGFSPLASFFTVCPATLAEDFDSLAICPTGCPDPCPLPNLWQNAPGDDYEWKVRTGPGLTYPVAGPPSASGGSGNYLYFRNSCTPSGANGKKAILRTLCLDLSAPAGPACHFSFDLYSNTKVGNTSSLALQVSTNGGLNWTTVQTWSGNRGKRWRREFVNLNAYDGQTVLFQLVATGALGAYGDLALDNLTFYGATPAGSPDYTFYRDQDGDGYGATNQPFVACSPQAPGGYATLPGDCNDNNANVYPGAPEILCNGVDENCNGSADDTFVAAPTAIAPAAVCSGDSATYTATSSPRGTFFWFENAAGGTPVATGNSFTVNNLTENTTRWLLDSLTVGGCASQRVAVTVQVNPTPDLLVGTLPELCAGESLDLGTLPIVELSGAEGSFTFHNSSPATPGNQLANNTIAPPASTTFWVKKTTTTGCVAEAPLPLVVRPRPTVSIANGDSLALCKNRSTVLTTTASASPLTYAWSNGWNFSTLPVTANGAGGTYVTYQVVVSDTNGCTASDAVVVKTLSSVTQTQLLGLQDVTFCGGANGSISLQPVDGQAPYTFAWSGASTGSLPGIGAGGGVISGLTQGGYRVTVTDASGEGCSMVLPTLVLNAPGLTVSNPTLTQPLCPGQTGSIAVTVNGTSPTFAWSDNGPATASRSDLGAGTYDLTVTDGACQQVLSGLSIVAPEPLQTLLNQQEQIACQGANDGVLEVAALGGTAPYTYQWNVGGPAQSLRTGLPPGVYRVTVTDANGCSHISPDWTLTQPPLLLVNSVVTPVSCFGGANGQIALNIQGGTAPYTIDWYDGQFTPLKNQLAAGTYGVTVTDANGCSAQRQVSVSQPSLLTLPPLTAVQPTCVGLPDGSLSANPSGGVGPYTFSWSNGLNTSVLNNLDADKYALVVTDANGCTTSSVTVLSAPQLLSVTLDSLSNVLCFNGNTGYLAVTVSGAVGALTTTWNGQAGASIWPSLTAGTYRLNATDSRGCAVRDTFVVTQPSAALAAVLVQITPAPCAGEPSGSIEVSTTGGTPPYTFDWSNGIDTEDLAAAAAGTYGLTVSDANGCGAGLGNLVVPEPDLLLVNSTIQNIPCYGTTASSILLDVAGGTPPYAFQWNNGLLTEDVYNLSAGVYTVTVFDAAGCVRVIERLEVLDLANNFVLQLTQNQPVSCNGTDDGRLVVDVLNGTPPYQFAWSPPVGLHANVATNSDAATQLSGGLYSLTVTDAAGCFRSVGPFLVEESPPVATLPVGIADVVCQGDSSGQIGVQVLGGVPPYQLNWSTGATNDTLTGLPAGTYQLTVTDQRGCTLLFNNLTVQEPAVGLQIVLDALVPDNCYEQAGAIDTHAEGGYAPYTYLWSNDSTTTYLHDLPPGLYSLTTTDAEGCTVDTTWEVGALAPPMALASYTVQPVACRGEANGAISVGVTGGSTPLQYFWNNGALGPNIGDLPPGTYRVTVSDATGCTEVFELPAVTQPAQPLTVVWDADSLANGWQVLLAPSGGWGAYTATWSDGGMGLVRTGLAAPAWYTVAVEDAEGCTKVLTIVLGTSATDEPGTAPAVVLQPNPVTTTAWLHCAASVAGSVEIRVWSALGQLEQQTRLEQPVWPLALDVGELAAGIYTVEIVLPRSAGRRVLRLVKI